MLKFIGIGSAFNTRLGNTSAYIKNEDKLLLIDCGNSVFHKLKEKNILNDIKKASIIITHTHSDHIGSLGDLVFYLSIVYNIKPKIIFPEKKILENYLNLIGLNKDMYSMDTKKEVNLDLLISKKCRIKFLKSTHVKEIPTFSFIIKYEDKKYFYSGDSNIISGEILAMFKNNIIDFIYQDTCGVDYEGNAHLSLEKLKKLIPENIRDRVYCIHYDESLTKEKVEESGFNYIEI